MPVANLADGNPKAQRQLLVVGAIVLPFLLIFPVFFFNNTLEDAHITFRYARNFFNGDGFGTWNPGEPPIEGYTSLLWMAIVATAQRLGFSFFETSKILGWGSLVCLPTLAIVAWYRAYNAAASTTESYGASWLLYAAVLYSVYLPLAWYAVSGMETVFFAAMAGGLLLIPRLLLGDGLRTLGALALSIGLVLTRPEGILVAGAINSFFLYQRVVKGNRYYWPLIALAGTLLTFLGLTLFRYIYFGDIVPNTYYAKANGGWLHLMAGAGYVLRFTVIASPLLALVVAAIIAKPRQLLTNELFVFLLLFVAVYCVYVIKVGADPKSAFPMWRHFVHIAPFWIGLVALSVNHLFKRLRIGVLVLLSAVFLVDGAVVYLNREPVVNAPLQSIGKYGFLKAQEPPNGYFLWLSKFSNVDTLSAVSLAGEWPYYVPGRYIDILGLNDRHIAKFGKYAAKGLTDSKTDMNYVLTRKPAIIDGYMDALALLDGKCPDEIHGMRSEMLASMINNQAFMSDYYFVTNAPYDQLNRALFVTKNFYEHYRNNGLEAVPVSSGPLYRIGCHS